MSLDLTVLWIRNLGRAQLANSESQRRSRRQRMRCLDGIIDSMDMNLSKLQETVKDRGDEWSVHEVAKSRTWLSDWTTTKTARHSSASRGTGRRSVATLGWRLWLHTCTWSLGGWTVLDSVVNMLLSVSLGLLSWRLRSHGKSFPSLGYTEKGAYLRSVECTKLSWQSQRWWFLKR